MDSEKRINELESVIYSIDFICRSVPDTQKAVEIIQDCCGKAEVESVKRGRKANQVA